MPWCRHARAWPRRRRLWGLIKGGQVRLRSCSLFFALILCAGAPALACVYPPPSPREANETEFQYRERSEVWIKAYLREGARKHEARYFERARNIYLARIIASKEINVDGSPFGRSIIVRPLEAIKGKAPLNVLVLRDRSLSSCGFGGDGPATAGAVSHIVIVFDRLDDPDTASRPFRYAMLASDIQTPALSAAWDNWKRRANFVYDRY